MFATCSELPTMRCKTKGVSTKVIFLSVLFIFLFEALTIYRNRTLNLKLRPYTADVRVIGIPIPPFFFLFFYDDLT